MTLEPPEGFEPYEWKSPYGTLMLPSAACLQCLMSWGFYNCSMCCFTHNMEEAAQNKWNKIWEASASGVMK